MGRKSALVGSLGASLATVLALTTVFASLVVSLGLAAPTSDMGQWTGLSPIREARAQAILARPSPGSADIAQARQETMLSLQQSPSNATAWLRLAYLERAPDGRLSPASLNALDKSYGVAPFGPDNTRWRLGFILDHWSQVTPDLRQSALDELRLTQKIRARTLRGLESEISDSGGRVVLALNRLKPVKISVK